jgi:glyceraldehyde 3-phosphate dehydrogenase
MHRVRPSRNATSASLRTAHRNRQVHLLKYDIVYGRYGKAENQRYRGVLGVSVDPLVSSDIIRDPRASVVDLSLTQVVDGDLIRVMSWYDNERGYSIQLVIQESMSCSR